MDAALQRAGQEADAQARNTEGDKRRAITLVARELFTTVGYESTTIAHVAGEAGVAVGTVYLYFKNKNDLLLAVKADWEAEVMSALMQPELSAIPFHRRVRPLIEAAFDICARHTEMVQLIGMQAAMIGERKPEPNPPIYAAMKAFLDEGRAAGAVRNVDTKAAAVLAYGMFFGALQQCFTVESGKNRRAYVDALVDAIERWLVRSEMLSSTEPEQEDGSASRAG